MPELLGHGRFLDGLIIGGVGIGMVSLALLAFLLVMIVLARLFPAEETAEKVDVVQPEGGIQQEEKEVAAAIGLGLALAMESESRARHTWQAISPLGLSAWKLQGREMLMRGLERRR